MKRAETDPSTVDLETVFEALGGHGGATALEAVARGAPDRLAAHTDTLADFLVAEDGGVRRAALVAVREAARGDPDGLGPLVDPLRDRLGVQAADEARLTGKALGELLDPDSPALSETLDALVAALREEPNGTHGHALVALGSAFPRETVAALEPLLSASDGDVVRAALRVLASLSAVAPAAAAEVAPAVGEHLTGDGERGRFAAEVLGNVVPENPTVVGEHVDRLADLLAADAAATRREAAGIACSLARADPDAADPLASALVERLSDADRIVRRDACYALGVVRAEQAREEIEALAADANPELSAVAERALDRIDGRTGEPPLPEIPPGEVFQHRGDGPDGELTPEDREAVRERRLRRREDDDG